MKEKINYAECMKRKCSECKYYDECFEYKPKERKMLIKAKRIDNLEKKVSEYKNKAVIKYLNSKGYECNESIKSMRKVNSLLKSEMKKVVIDIQNERLSRIGAYYTWEAYIKVKIIDTITGKEV
ncbi:MAG: hypothetical protein HFJ40_05920 [Clostridia bacterium]|nr:hypothetical protein [Clostridia bacterium]